MKFIFNMGIFVLLAFCASAQKSATESGWKSYTNDPATIEKVDDLIRQMTLEEKIGQMTQFAGQGAVTGPEIGDEFKTYLEKGMVGSMFNVFGAEGLRQLQEQAMSKSRLKIPILFAADVIHGYETTFPMPLAESCSWDLDLMEKSARIAAEEATAAGISWTFAPMVDVGRDARWGRVMEGAGEDVFLGEAIAKARVKGFQGINSWQDFAKPNTMLACAKHFVAYGAAEAGRDYNTVDVSRHTLFETYFPPFEACIVSGVATFMTSFNEIAGVPATGNKYLYTDILRDQWDFRGMVVTDYTAINEMIDHGYAADLQEAALKSAQAGIDMDMNGAAFVQHLKTLYDQGKISEEQINIAAARVLEMKVMLGLFEDPFRYMDPEREKATIGKPEYLEEARKGAQRSIVLLKNEGDILPLQKTDGEKIALIGPMIKERNSLNGEWAIRGNREESVTIFEGLQEKYQDSGMEFLYAKGCDLLNEEKEQGFEEALNIAKQADKIIVAMGEDFNWSGEAASRTNIQLPVPQRKLLMELKKTGKPIILIVLNGRPLNLSWEDENLQAIVEAWYPGTMAGHAIADIISGDYNPSAKLTMSFPRNVGQCPIYYNAKNTGRPLDPNQWADYKSSYLDVPNSPLYVFGHGLSYTTFEYSGLSLSRKTFSAGGEIEASITIKNTGNHDGEEIVQLYLHDQAASVTRPVKELKGFDKVFLKKGESRTVTFTIDESLISFYNSDLKWGSEAGKFDLWIGKSSADESQHVEFAFE
ncbi:beta-glucosidase BglX [Persicobacter diffluens]|uniref:beta-glucosidase n=1 Tax=Persicobacter diffluens TaxID=981 RepID=A0AAN5AMP9_9BACT|nr:glycosyl hydrolase [Persicobacter diffluens]